MVKGALKVDEGHKLSEVHEIRLLEKEEDYESVNGRRDALL
jgi:hypothetical protein